MNSKYLTSIEGILRLAAIGLSLLAFICAIVPYWSTPAGGGWNQFVAIITFLVSGAMFLLILLDKTGVVPSFLLIDLIVAAVLVLFNFIAFIIACVLAARYSGQHCTRSVCFTFANYGALIAAAVFFAFLLAVLAVILFFAFRAFRSGAAAGETTVTKTTTVTTTSTVA